MSATDERPGCYCLRERRALQHPDPVSPRPWCDAWPNCRTPQPALVLRQDAKQ